MAPKKAAPKAVEQRKARSVERIGARRGTRAQSRRSIAARVAKVATQRLARRVSAHGAAQKKNDTQGNKKANEKHNDAGNKKTEGNRGRKTVPPTATTRDKNNNATTRPNKKDERQAQEEDVDPAPRADGNNSARSDRSASPRSRKETDKLVFSGRANGRKKVNNEENQPGRSDQLQEASTQDVDVTQEEVPSRAPKRQHDMNGEDRLDGGSDTDGDSDYTGPETRQRKKKRAARRARMEGARNLIERNDEAGQAEDGNEHEAEQSETDDEGKIMDRFRNHRHPRVRMTVVRDHVFPYSWCRDYNGVEVFGKRNFFSKKN